MEFDGPLRLDPWRHELGGFVCVSEAQSRWLRRIAPVALAAGTAVTYVITPRADDRVVGYHALAAASLEQDAASARIRGGSGRSSIPVILLARLGVHRDFEGQGLGRTLVRDAVLRARSAADVIGARALLVHAETAAAREFYQHLAEFEPSPVDPLHLALLFSDVDRARGG